MKKGFTMIELIFVIVILGVLASVAIPRLAATRDDAEVAKAATNLTTAISDITAYYTGTGGFGDFKTMTNALTQNGDKGELKILKTTCATISLDGINYTSSGKKESTSTGTANGKIIITKGTGGNCDTLWKMPGVANICQEEGSSSNKKCTITLGGSGVDW